MKSNSPSAFQAQAHSASRQPQLSMNPNFHSASKADMVSMSTQKTPSMQLTLS